MDLLLKMLYIKKSFNWFPIILILRWKFEVSNHHFLNLLGCSSFFFTVWSFSPSNDQIRRHKCSKTKNCWFIWSEIFLFMFYPLKSGQRANSYLFRVQEIVNGLRMIARHSFHIFNPVIMVLCLLNYFWDINRFSFNLLS